jgi:hypothetical protein
MEQLSSGQIYLIDQRGLSETNTYRRYSTFNYGDYQNQHKTAFGNLSVFNDEIIAAKQKVELTIAANSFVVLIPITGIAAIKIGESISQDADAGEVFINYADAGTVITIENTYENDWINFLYLEIRRDRGNYDLFPSLFSFDLTEKQNDLVEVVAAEVEKFPFAISMGLFQGREETIYKMRSEKSKLFSFIISGVFELQGRLMHDRDGLALWNLQEADMEALSNNAVIMVLELY